LLAAEGRVPAWATARDPVLLPDARIVGEPDLLRRRRRPSRARFPPGAVGSRIFFEHPLAEVDEPPAPDAMPCRDRAVFDHARKHCTAVCGHRGGWPAALPTMSTECPWALNLSTHPAHPKRHAADLGRLRACRSLVNGSQRQKAARRTPLLRLLRLLAKGDGVEIVSNRDRHREPRRSQHRVRSSPIPESKPSQNQRELV
jgi:hypothetical protein